MLITYRKNTGEVVMLGQQIDNASLASIKVPTDQRMKEGYKMIVKNGIVEYEKPWWMDDKEKEAQNKIDLAKDIVAIQNATDIDELKPLILKLIQKLNK